MTTPQERKPALIIVGSYVPKTTSQLNRLLENKNLVAIPLSVDRIIANDLSRAGDMDNSLIEVEKHLSEGRHTVVYTSRELVQGSNVAENLAIGEHVTGFLVELVSRISVQPSFIVAKGGITSNDVAVAGLGMKRAKILGQVIPGVPVWELGPETRFLKMPYVVFPGNVGDDESLKRVFDILAGSDVGY